MSVFDLIDTEYTYNDEKHSVKVKRWMSASEKIGFVRNVTDAVIADGGYDYMLQDMMCDYFIVQYLTGNEITVPEDVENQIDYIEDFMFGSDIVDVVFDAIGYDLVDYYKNAVAYNIEYKTGVRIDNLRNEIADFIRSINKMNKDVDVDKMNDVIDKLSNVSGDITPDSLMSAYANNEDVIKRFNDAMSSKDDKNGNDI